MCFNTAGCFGHYMTEDYFDLVGKKYTDLAAETPETDPSA